MATKIPISQLGQLAYCEYKIYFKDWLKKHKKKVPFIQSKEIIAGAQAHQELKENHIEVDTKELVNKRELSVSCDTLRGKIDEIVKSPTEIRIIEDKPHDIAYQGDQWQVLAYCKCYREIHQEEIDEDTKIIAVVRCWKTNTEIWTKEFTEEDNKLIIEKTDRIIGILDGSITANSTDNPAKCNKCNLKKTCDKSLYVEFDVKKLISGE